MKCETLGRIQFVKGSSALYSVALKVLHIFIPRSYTIVLLSDDLINASIWGKVCKLYS